MAKLNFRTAWVIFPKVAIEANPEYNSDEAVRDIQIDIGSDLTQDDDNSLNATLFVSNDDFAENNARYSIDIQVFGNFNCNMPFSKIPKKMANEVVLDMANLLLGSVRELVANVTARGPWGTYILPFVSAEELAKSLLEDFLEHRKPLKVEKSDI